MGARRVLLIAGLATLGACIPIDGEPPAGTATPTATPGAASPTPAAGTATPALPTPTPGSPTASPIPPTPTAPGATPTATPGISTSTPGMPTPTPGISTPTPGMPTPTAAATPTPTPIPLDCPPLADLAQHEARFSAEIYPLMIRDAGGCVACHAQGLGRQMTMGPTASDTFYRLRAEGFLAAEGASTMLGRVSATGPTSMPQGGPHWSDGEIAQLRCAVTALAEFELGEDLPPDEAFPPNLLAPYEGPASTTYDNTWLSWRQLQGRIAVQFGDDWVRDGEDLFDAHIRFFGGVNFDTAFVPNRQPTADYLLGMDLLGGDVCGRAVERRSGPFSGMDLDGPILEEPAPTLTYYDAPDIDPPTQGDTWNQGGDEIALIWANGYVGVSVDLPIEGVYRITGWAEGDEAGLDLPEMAIAVDGVFVQTFDVPETGAYKPYFVDVSISAGPHYIALYFTNDYYQEALGLDRNLYVTGLEVDGPEPGSTAGGIGALEDTRARLSAVMEAILLRPAGLRDPEEVDALYGLLLELVSLDGDLPGAYRGVCEALLKHPDFLFTRPPSFDAASPAEREPLLFLRTALDLLDRPPTAEEWARFEEGEPREAFIPEWLASEAFLEAYFYQSRIVLESDGSVVADEPARMFTYLFTAERPVGELLTGDYTVSEGFEAVPRPDYYGPTGVLTTEGYIHNKPGLPHYNYAARVLSDFMGYVFEVPPEIVDSRAGSTAASTVDPTSVCYSCHQLLTPLAHQRLRWDDAGQYRDVDDAGDPIDDSDRGMVEGYPFPGSGMAAFGAQAVRKERFTRRMADTQFERVMGRPIRADDDERALYHALFEASAQGDGTLREIMEIILMSEPYTDPVGSRGEEGR